MASRVEELRRWLLFSTTPKFLLPLNQAVQQVISGASWGKNVFRHETTRPCDVVNPSLNQYSTGTGSKMRHRYHAAAVR